jgi:uncharacterized repeat protein (TIGR03803 family)
MTRLPICRVGAILLFCAAAVTSVLAQDLFFQSLASFDGSNGAGPHALVQGTDGNFYGTTQGGGTNNSGTVFQLKPGGALTTLYNFCLQPNCADGANPMAGLVQGADGNFYGTTAYGGVNQNCEGETCGTVFVISPSGNLGTIYSFCSQRNCADGSAPFAGLVQGTDGDFYGTTLNGGSNNCMEGCGTIFRISPWGGLTTLYRFPQAANPGTPLVQGTDGNFYGTAGGGVGGGVFQITAGGMFAWLYGFCSPGPYCSDGSLPAAGLVQGTDGNFYGTTEFGGNQNSSCGLPGWGCGTVFQITPAGALTTLYRFCPGSICTDGSNPTSALMQATDGNFYGTTPYGGGKGSGTVFQITSAGALTTLYSFCSQTGCVDGAIPYANLVQARDTNFYGTTLGGGVGHDGTVFRLGPVRPCSMCGL